MLEKYLANYLRLSKEDGDLLDESNSITNQRYIINDYIESHPELSKYEVREYVDDGYSGKNFDRPGVKQLLQDVKKGKIYGIAVKDFSRFGREHIELGDYIEKIFPVLGVRFLAVNNSFDSNDYIGTTPDIDVAFENLICDYYSEENSIKIKNDLLKLRKRGSYMSTFAAFGYQKSEKDKHQLIVDEAAANIVQLIFNLYSEYRVKAEVARYLNNNSILTPQEYAQSIGRKYKWKYQEGTKMWSGSIIGRILKNQTYIGNMVFHKKEAKAVGSRKSRCIPKDEWYICENTHEPIIDKALFWNVNEGLFAEAPSVKIKLDRGIYCEGEKRKKGNANSPIKGYVRCGGCKHTLTRRNRLNATYYCRHYYEVKSSDCCSINIKEANLIQLVLQAIRTQAALVADLNELYQRQRENERLEKEKSKHEHRDFLNKIEQFRLSNFNAYEKYSNGELSRDELKQTKDSNNKSIANLEMMLQDFVKGRKSKIEEPSLVSAFSGKEALDELSREIVEEVVEGIYVYNVNKIEIIFNFEDEVAKLVK